MKQVRSVHARWVLVGSAWCVLAACGGESTTLDGQDSGQSGDGSGATDAAGGSTTGGSTSTGAGGAHAGAGGASTGGSTSGAGGVVESGGSCDVEGSLGMVDCNTCVCTSGAWLCTKKACIDPGCEVIPDANGCSPCRCVNGEMVCADLYCPTECQEGATKMADDGCNTCTCAAGAWACTEKACEPKWCGGWEGDTCSDSEYCAYEVGALCGATDASAVCKTRPDACDQVYSPVCGCDGATYSNACMAAVAGTGVMYAEACR